MRGRSTTPTRAIITRRIGGLVGAGVLVATVACQPEPPPPRDLITSVSASSSVAGQLTTITVRVGENEVGGSPWINLGEGAGPGDAKLPASSAPDACAAGSMPAQAIAVSGGSELTLTCRLPETMVNGPWTIAISASGSFGTTWGASLPLVVTGGTDDVTPPVLTILAPQSQVVPRGGSFPVLYRIADDHLAPNTQLSPSWFQFQGNKPYDTTFFCAGPDDQFLRTQVSPTVIEVSFTCKVPTVLEPGLYKSFLQAAGDIYGRSTPIQLSVSIS